ncbi:hypothetical protein RB597_000906 [Gaeumannomyces tritici]
MASKTKATAKHGYHFFGPYGAFGISFCLPALLYILAFACNDISGCPAPSLLNLRSLSLETLKQEVGWPGFRGLMSWKATLAVFGYHLLGALLYRFLPATEMEGTELFCGGKLKYRLNAFASSICILVLCLAGTISQGSSFPVWVIITEDYLQVLTANMAIAYFLATFVYVRSFSVKPGNRERRQLAEGGQTGNPFYDWFIGRELNPRVTLPIIGEIDIKEYMELRPGLLFWALLDLAFLAKQHRNFGFVSNGAVFVTAVQTLYVLDSHYNEPAVLTTLDIISDGFGMMLSFGDIVWVPLLHSQQMRYLSVHPVSLSPWGMAGVAILLVASFAAFRLSNNQKNLFRSNPQDPRVAHLKYIDTKAGTRLLVSGWWGISRHFNYLADWMQAWPYSLPTGAAGYVILAAGGQGDDGPSSFRMLDGREVVPGPAQWYGVVFTYLYVVYFACLLIHRASRDDEKCAGKYGQDWERYKAIVRWKILPYVY